MLSIHLSLIGFSDIQKDIIRIRTINDRLSFFKTKLRKPIQHLEHKVYKLQTTKKYEVVNWTNIPAKFGDANSSKGNQRYIYLIYEKDRFEIIILIKKYATYRLFHERQ